MTGSWLFFVVSITCDNSNNYYVSDPEKGYIVRINEEAIALISAGPNSGMPKGEPYEDYTPGNLVLFDRNIYDARGRAVTKINIQNGGRIIISSTNQIGTGPEIINLFDIVYSEIEEKANANISDEENKEESQRFT